MEVMPPPSLTVTGEKLKFRSTCPSPCSSPETESPQVSDNYFFSAPSSPTNSSPFNRQISFAFFATGLNTHNSEPNLEDLAEEEDFAFDFSVDSTAEEDFAFDFGGQKEITPPPPPPPPLQADHRGGVIKAPPPKKTLQNAVSFRHRKKYSDHCAKSTDRVYDSCKKKSAKATPKANKLSEEMISMERSSSSSSSWYIKWKLPELLLLRSASEGHETNKKYPKNMNENMKNSSGGSRKKKEMVAGHELHYKVNRATTTEMRRKTFLPYKQNLMGCMDINSLVLDPSTTRGINMRRQ